MLQLVQCKNSHGSGHLLLGEGLGIMDLGFKKKITTPPLLRCNKITTSLRGIWISDF